jgi:hypothetical protein
MKDENISKFRLDKIAKELDGKWYTQVVADKFKEHKRIVIEYGHKKVNN